MDQHDLSGDFYAGVPVFDGFAQLMDPALYVPLPDDWLIGIADVVSSTRAIEAGRYKEVNIAGAALIAALSNALGGRAMPSAFGGDGAAVAIAPEHAEVARHALATTAAWVRDELGLMLRVALIPVSAIRAAGPDVRLARFAASAHVSYAMFTGGGLAWAEERMKAGDFAIPPAPPGSRPDLTGLSCRWQPVPAERGVTLSLILIPMDGGQPDAFRRLVEEVLDLVSEEAGAGRPISVDRFRVRWPPRGFALEAKASRPGARPLLVQRLSMLFWTLVAFAVFRSGLRVAGFDPRAYKREMFENADFRKYEDGLRMTIDCPLELADRLEARLERAARAGSARYGLHRQDAAMITCFAVNPRASDHIHFVDGAGGGYAMAARALKAGAGAAAALPPPSPAPRAA